MKVVLGVLVLLAVVAAPRACLGGVAGTDEDTEDTDAYTEDTDEVETVPVYVFTRPPRPRCAVTRFHCNGSISIDWDDSGEHVTVITKDELDALKALAMAFVPKPLK